jgi:deoxyribodipyrimidine photo-lyase
MPHHYKYNHALFIFRRDLRLPDNTALNQALTQARHVIPCFIFDPQQIQPHPYQSLPGLQFMLKALQSLQQELTAVNGNLALFHAAPEAVIQQLFTGQAIEAVYFNRDYTPFSRRRDDKIVQLCHRLEIDVYSIPDVLLHEPEQCLKADGTPYKVFTAFYNNAKQSPLPLPQPLSSGQFLNLTTEIDIAQFQPAATTASPLRTGSREDALATLQNLSECKHYEAERDFPALDKTSRLSAHLKFGTCSVREAYYSIAQQLGIEHPLLRQLYWRDFFHHLAYFFPSVFGTSFLPQFANLPVG